MSEGTAIKIEIVESMQVAMMVNRIENMGNRKHVAFIPSMMIVAQCTGGHTEVPNHFLVPLRGDLYQQDYTPHD